MNKNEGEKFCNLLLEDMNVNDGYNFIMKYVD